MDKSVFDKVSAQHIINSKKATKEIASLYDKWGDSLLSEYKGKTIKTNSDRIRKAQAEALVESLKNQGKALSQELESYIKSNLYKTSNSVVSANIDMCNKWFGLDSSIAFVNVNTKVVDSIVTGKLYGYKGITTTFLSSRIWEEVENTQSELQRIVAGGIAQNKGVYEIAKDLASYIKPSAKKDWNLIDKDGKKIYPKKVEYSAQRLARTMSQHAYQQSIVESSKINPFIQKIKWHANGSRACDLCMFRDGKEYAISKVPLDHPNGMCVMEPIISESDEEIQNKIVEWYKGKEDEDIDDYLEMLGFNAEKLKTQSRVVATNTQAKIVKPFNEEEWKQQLLSQKEQTFREEWYYNYADKVFDEKDKTIVNHYTDSYYQDMNKALRRDDDALADEMQRVYNYNNGFSEKLKIKDINARLNRTLSKLSTPEEVIVRRGSDYNMLKDLGIDYSEQNLSNVVGSVVKDKGFFSTSPISGGGLTGEYEYIVKIPKNSQAAYVAPISRYQSEREILVNSGGNFRIENVEYSSSGRVRKIWMTLVNLQKI